MPVFAQVVPGEEALTDTMNSAWDHLPPEAAALFIVLIIILVGGIWLATTYMRTYGAKKKEKTEAPPPPSAPSASSEPRSTRTFWEGITKQAIAAERSKIDETQDDRLNRVESRIDDIFKLEGKHRLELIEMVRDLRTELKELGQRLEKQVDKSDRKNETQDVLLHGLSQSLATLQGMIAAKRTGRSTGVTQFIEPDDPEDT